MAIVIKEIIVRTTVERGKTKEPALSAEWPEYIRQTVEEQLCCREEKQAKKEKGKMGKLQKMKLEAYDNSLMTGSPVASVEVRLILTIISWTKDIGHSENKGAGQKIQPSTLINTRKRIYLQRSF